MSDPFQLKGRLFTLSVLNIANNDLTQLDKVISEKIKLAPKFFQHSPIVLDCTGIDWENTPLDLAALKATLEKHKLIPVGVKNLPDEQIENAFTLGLAKMTDQSQSTTPQEALTTHNRLITQPIRSGQQVYAQGGDLIVLSSVSPGAELLADGNIHVYGTLRGRVLAGVNGDTQARIFCHRLEAELIAIAGHYKVFEELETGHDASPKQICLEGEQLKVEAL